MPARTATEDQSLPLESAVTCWILKREAIFLCCSLANAMMDQNDVLCPCLQIVSLHPHLRARLQQLDPPEVCSGSFMTAESVDRDRQRVIYDWHAVCASAAASPQ